MRISFLAAILFPAFGRAREDARRSSCSSNMKQIGLGIIQYLQDFDGTYPMSTTALNGVNLSWRQAIQPYIKSTQVMQLCRRSRQIAAPAPHHERDKLRSWHQPVDSQ